jgi:SAM-dependent methyltransferase
MAPRLRDAATLPKRMRRRLMRIGVTGEQWLRVVMDLETLKLVEALAPEHLDALEISGCAWGQRTQFKSYESVRYPDFDICESVPTGSFDLIIAEQVFEHLSRPLEAGKNIYQALRPGGHFLITTPFLIKPHPHPIDCSRWTPTGLSNLLVESGFCREGVRAYSWGNRACLRANLRGSYKSWINYRPRLHSLENQPDFPLVVWAIAEKS